MKKWLKHLVWKNITQDTQYEEVQMTCPGIVIPDISKDLYDKLLSEAAAAGAGFNGNRASISGCDFDWNYDAVSMTLSITCIRKPFYATCPEVESRIRDLVTKAKEGI
jgi:hypothetical protein